MAERRRVYKVDEALELVDGLISRTFAYEQIRRTGKLLGVDVIRVGRKVLIPARAFDRVLDEGMTSGDDAA